MEGGKIKGYKLEIVFDDEELDGQRFDIEKMGRTVIIPENTTMEELHQIIQRLFGFKSIHYYEFSYDDESQEDLRGFGYERQKRLCSSHQDLGKVYVDDYFEKKISFDYEYDYGCEWRFSVRFIMTVKYDKFYPTILDFDGQYNIVGSCGGPWGLEYYLKIINEPPETLSKNDRQIINRFEKFDMEKTQEELIECFDISD